MVAKVTELEPITKRKNRIESNISADHKTPQNGNIQTTNPEVAGSNPAGRAILRSRLASDCGFFVLVTKENQKL